MVNQVKDLVTWLFTDQRAPWSEQNRPGLKLGAEVLLAASLVPIYRWSANQILLKSEYDGIVPVLLASFSPVFVGFFAAITRKRFSFLAILNTVDWVGRIMALHLAMVVLCARFLRNATRLSLPDGKVGDFPWWTEFDFWLAISGAILLTTALWAWTVSERRLHGLWTVSLYIVAVVLVRTIGLVEPDHPWWPRALDLDQYD